MKGKTKSFLSFVIFMTVFAIVWYFTVRHYRSWDIDAIRLQDILYTEIEPRVQLTLAIQAPPENIKDAQDTFKNEHSYQLFYNKHAPGRLSSNIELEIKCGGTREITAESAARITYDADCADFSKNEWREVRRVVNFFGKNILDNDPSAEKSYLDRLLIFDVYLYGAREERDAGEDVFRARVTQYVLRFLEHLGANSERVRINFWTIQKGEYDSLDKAFASGSTNISTLKRITDETPGVLRARDQNRIYYDKYRECSLFFVAGGDALPFFDEDASEKTDYVAVNNHFFVALPDVRAQDTVKDAIAYALHDFFDVNSFYQVLDTLQHTRMRARADVVASYFRKREFLLHCVRVKKQIQTLLFLNSEDTIIFTEQNQEQIKEWMEQTERFLAPTADFSAQRRVIEEQDNLNELDEIGILFSFQDEYTMGVYLPLLIPLLWPFILTAIKKIKEIKDRKSGAQQKLKED